MRDQTTASDGQVAFSREPNAEKPKPLKRVGNTKTDALRKLLLRPNGATVAQIQKRLIWQPHTVRAAISRLRISGATIELDQSGRTARYRTLSTEEGQ